MSSGSGVRLGWGLSHRGRVRIALGFAPTTIEEEEYGVVSVLNCHFPRDSSHGRRVLLLFSLLLFQFIILSTNDKPFYRSIFETDLNREKPNFNLNFNTLFRQTTLFKTPKPNGSLL